MNIQAKIKKIEYEPLLCNHLEEVNIRELGIGLEKTPASF